MRRLLPCVLLMACATPSASRPGSSLEGAFGPAVAARLEQALSARGCVWVTDADGTLWQSDIGEGFLKQLIADHALVSPEAQGVDVWQSYEARVAKDKSTGYAWAAQVMAGLPEEEVIRRADAFAKTFVPEHVHPEMRALLEAAKARGCTPWIVSASPQWIVEAGARVLGLPAEHAVGIRVAVKEGHLTSEIVAPITNRGGKVEAIQKYIGQTPALVTGDSSGDTEMLNGQTVASLLIVHPGKTDPALLTVAQQHGWLTHSVPPGH